MREEPNEISIGEGISDSTRGVMGEVEEEDADPRKEVGDPTLKPDPLVGSAKAHADRAKDRRRELKNELSSDTTILLDSIKRIRWSAGGDMGNVIRLIPPNRVPPAMAAMMTRPIMILSSFRIPSMVDDERGKQSRGKVEFEEGYRPVIGVCEITGATGQLIGVYGPYRTGVDRNVGRRRTRPRGVEDSPP